MHSLEDDWMLWVNYDWTTFHKIGEFSTIETFWMYFNNIKKPSLMKDDTNCSFFKKGILPKWEDPNNINGGKLIIVVSDVEQVDAIWENLVLSIIGGIVSHNDITGIAINVKNKSSKISIWTRNSLNLSGIDDIATMVKSHINNYEIRYYSHNKPQKGKQQVQKEYIKL